jgi:hypothetical protein
MVQKEIFLDRILDVRIVVYKKLSFGRPSVDDEGAKLVRNVDVF